MAYRGTIKNIFPPSNNGQSRGAGMLDGDTGNNVVFQTPGDNNSQILSIGQEITYEIDEHGQISSISTSAPLGGA